MDGLVGSRIEAKTSRVEGILFVVVLSSLILPHSQRISLAKKYSREGRSTLLFEGGVHLVDKECIV